MNPTRFQDDLANFVWEHAVSPMAFVGREGEWLRTNPALCELLGFSRIELEKMTFQDITHPADVDADVSMVRDCLAGKIDGYPMTKRYITKMGKVIWIKLRVDCIRDNNEVLFFLSQITPTREYGEPPPAAPVKPNTSIGDVSKYLRENWKWLMPVFSGIGYIAWLVLQDLIVKITGNQP